MAINQIKIANELKQDTMIANNADILDSLNNYGVIKSKQTGYIEGSSTLIPLSPALPTGSDIKLVSISPVNINKSILNIRSAEVGATSNVCGLVLKADGIYTTPLTEDTAQGISHYYLLNVDWEVIEYK